MIIQFSPSKNNNFIFNVTMDNVKYNCVCSWNLFGQRYYITMLDINNNRIFTLPIIASPNDYNINIAEGYFLNSTLVYRATTNQFEITP